MSNALKTNRNNRKLKKKIDTVNKEIKVKKDTIAIRFIFDTVGIVMLICAFIGLFNGELVWTAITLIIAEVVDIIKKKKFSY